MTAALRAAGEASLSAAVMILAVLALRLRFQDRTPRRVFCLLWDIVLARLLVLGSLPSPVSIQRWLPGAAAQPAVISQASVGAVIVGEPAWTEVLVTKEETACLAAGDAVSWSFQPAPPPDRDAVLTALWLAGALLLAGWFLWNHLRSRKVYAASLPCRDAFVLDWLAEHPLRRPVQARVSDQIAAPLTYGVLDPVILLPRGIDDQEALACVLAHEHEHIRRFDALRKALLAAALCLHWFNPLVWAMYVLANRDIELACDEAALRGGADRERYALALLSMEERRGRWSPSGSHFSGHALEERIKAIMKRKHFSITALVAVLAVMCVTVTVFASSEPKAKASAKDDAPVTGYVSSETDNRVTIMSNGETDEKLYSIDNGASWMSEERYQAEYGSWGDDWQVEWWTYEDYKAWLEQEKKDLQEIIGSKGYTGSRGWFTWDQKMVDETIAMYEDILEKIKDGALYSKTILDKNGKEITGVALGSDTPLDLVTGAAFDKNDIVQAVPNAVDKAALLEELKAFGISGNEDRMTYNGQLVRTFVDGASIGDNGCSMQYVYTNDQGTVDVHTLRSVIHNPDGSYDVMGDLIGVAAAGDAGFDQGLIDSARSSGGLQATAAEGTADVVSTRFNSPASMGSDDGYDCSRLLEEVKAFGVTGTPDALYYKGQPVRSLVDGIKMEKEPHTYYTFPCIFDNPNGTINLQIQRNDKGEMTGILSERDAGFDPVMLELISTDDMLWRGYGSIAPENGDTVEAIFAGFEKYGLLYLPRECGIGSVTYNDQPVRSFADLKPDDGVFSYEDPYVENGLKVYTQYDENGRLAGLTAEPMPVKDAPAEKQTLSFDCAAPVQGQLSVPYGIVNGKMHHGVDIAADKGSNITAFAYGVVSETGYDASLGNYVVISHLSGYSTLYAHCGSIAVSKSDSVKAGDKIAEVGASGTATGPVLHFELRNGSTYLDPALYLTF